MKSMHTEEQLVWLRSQLPEYERRSTAQIRGDAKSFALECAVAYIKKWGLGEVAKEGLMKERIYTWFKNASARSKDARKKVVTRNSSIELSTSDSPSAVTAPYNMYIGSSASVLGRTEGIIPYPAANHVRVSSQQLETPSMPETAHGVMNSVPLAVLPVSHSHSHPHSQPQIQSRSQPLSPSYGTTIQLVPPRTPVTPLSRPADSLPGVTASFLDSSVHGRNLASIVCRSAASQPAYCGFSAVIQSLHQAATMYHQQQGANPVFVMEAVTELMKRYKSMIPFLPPDITHFGATGPHAALKALRVVLRRNSSWVALSAFESSMSPPNPLLAPTSRETTIHDQMRRNSMDRNRRKEFLIWSMIHSAAYEVNLLGPSTQPSEFGISPGQTDQDDGSAKLGESIAKDGLYESEESDWVAGSLLLRAMIRRLLADPTIDKTAAAVHSLKEEWRNLVSQYEQRWNAVRDESRQAAMEESLSACRQALGI